MGFLENEEGLVLSVKGIVGILKHSVPKFWHSGLLCLYIAEKNTVILYKCSHTGVALVIVCS